jgi:protein-tyrosine-phosphatase
VERVLFVCLGNICRSPMAEGLWRRILVERGLPTDAVDSAGTGGWHAGEGAHSGTAAVLRRVGADFPHAARQVVRADFDTFDRILAMDANNLRDLRARAPAGCRAPPAPRPRARGRRATSRTRGARVRRRSTPSTTCSSTPWTGGPPRSWGRDRSIRSPASQAPPMPGA